jgi:DNA-binding beta-propeller fold protein YncE
MPAATPSIEREPVRAPDFPPGFTWLNTDHPLTLRELRGRVVLLDFWTYCCINCQHVLPDLAYLEQKYAGSPFTVVGVHSAKFDNEQEPANIRDAILRHGIGHPVVVDQDHTIWDAYGVRGWPTLVLLDPQGYVLGAVSGEGHRDLLDSTIAQVLDAYSTKGMLSSSTLALPLERDLHPITALSYPGKVLADAVGNRLFIADSGYHRLVICDLDGRPLDVIGTGTPGRDDGPFETATFQAPQGMALLGNFLYVTDTENHLIRRLDLAARTVETVAGTGVQARGRGRGGPARETALNSPWDLCAVADQIYIAMAGPHQIWRFDPALAEVAVFAGSGREARIDGEASEAAFAQPSGITTDGRQLFVADSEISSVRVISPGRPPVVHTLAGGDLFAFGDRDGVGDTVRLQHPLGLTYAEGVLYLADTYNHKIKRADPASGSVLTLLGDGIAGDEGGERPRFREPGGLSVAAGRLYIADTNNHRIQVTDLLAPGVAGAVRTLDLQGLCAPGMCLPGK